MYNFNLENIDIKFLRKDLIENYFLFPKGKSKSKGFSMSSNFNIEKSKSILEKLYVEEQFGLKSIVKILDIPDCTYSVLRKIFSILNIDIRKGKNVITDKLKTMRSINAAGEKNPWSNWPSEKPDMHSNSKKYVGGYYENKSKKKYVYLRSSWEYAYAKWLDQNSYDWDVEVKSFRLSDNRNYRPDFFLYDSEGNIIEILEVKAKYLDDSSVRIDKFNIFSKEYPEIKSSILFKEQIFKEKNISYEKNLKEWKSIRKTKNEIRKL